MGKQMLQVEFASKSFGMKGKNRPLTMTVMNPRAYLSVAVATPRIDFYSLNLKALVIHGVSVTKPQNASEVEISSIEPICEYCPIDSADYLIVLDADDRRGKLSHEELLSELPGAMKYGKDYRARYDNFIEEVVGLEFSRQRNK